METRLQSVQSGNYPSLQLEMLPGHFATRHSHVNYYLNMTEIKCRHTMAMDAGKAFAELLMSSTPVETIVCLDGTEIIAAYLAEALCRTDADSAMSGSSINIITPETNHNGQFIFRDNVQKNVWNKQILLLVASATTGATMSQAIQCVHYYHGRISAISAIFSAVDSIDGQTVHALFTKSDIPGYETYLPVDCPDCKAGGRIEALVNSYGYSKL
jgi:orotate phosphoribosyltransferase